MKNRSYLVGLFLWLVSLYNCGQDSQFAPVYYSSTLEIEDSFFLKEKENEVLQITNKIRKGEQTIGILGALTNGTNNQICRFFDLKGNIIFDIRPEQLFSKQSLIANFCESNGKIYLLMSDLKIVQLNMEGKKEMIIQPQFKEMQNPFALDVFEHSAKKDVFLVGILPKGISFSSRDLYKKGQFNKIIINRKGQLLHSFGEFPADYHGKSMPIASPVFLAKIHNNQVFSLYNNSSDLAIHSLNGKKKSVVKAPRSQFRSYEIKDLPALKDPFSMTKVDFIKMYYSTHTDLDIISKEHFRYYTNCRDKTISTHLKKDFIIIDFDKKENKYTEFLLKTDKKLTFLETNSEDIFYVEKQKGKLKKVVKARLKEL